MELKWENIENAIYNLMEFEKIGRFANLYNLKPKNLLKINNRYYLVEKGKNYGDWAEYTVKDILTNGRAYLEIDDGEISLWHRLNKLEEKEILAKIKNKQCELLESGKTDEYKYQEFVCGNNLYSLEEYPDGSKEIYKYNQIFDIKVI